MTGTLDSTQAQRLSELGGMLSEPSRMEILRVLCEEPGGLEVKTVAARTKIRPSVASHHLQRMLRARVVRFRSSGQTRIYEVAAELEEEFRDLLGQLFWKIG